MTGKGKCEHRAVFRQAAVRSRGHYSACRGAYTNVKKFRSRHFGRSTRSGCFFFKFFFLSCSRNFLREYVLPFWAKLVMMMMAGGECIFFEGTMSQVQVFWCKSFFDSESVLVGYILKSVPEISSSITSFLPRGNNKITNIITVVVYFLLLLYWTSFRIYDSMIKSKSIVFQFKNIIIIIHTYYPADDGPTSTVCIWMNFFKFWFFVNLTFHYNFFFIQNLNISSFSCYFLGHKLFLKRNL